MLKKLIKPSKNKFLLIILGICASAALTTQAQADLYVSTNFNYGAPEVRWSSSTGISFMLHSPASWSELDRYAENHCSYYGKVERVNYRPNSYYPRQRVSYTCVSRYHYRQPVVRIPRPVVNHRYYSGHRYSKHKKRHYRNNRRKYYTPRTKHYRKDRYPKIGFSINI